MNKAPPSKKAKDALRALRRAMREADRDYQMAARYDTKFDGGEWSNGWISDRYFKQLTHWATVISERFGITIPDMERANDGRLS